MQLISNEYRKLCEDMHDAAPWGTKGYRYIEEFLPYCRKLGCTNILDYGCGRGTIKQHLAELYPEIDVVGYDPGIIEYADLPTAMQFVVCTDVMEHVEEQFVPATLAKICELTQVGAYFCIALTKAKRNLPDGRNAHITLKSGEWWVREINRLPWSVVRQNIGKKSLRLWLRKV